MVLSSEPTLAENMYCLRLEPISAVECTISSWSLFFKQKHVAEHLYLVSVSGYANLQYSRYFCNSLLLYSQVADTVLTN